MCNKTLWLLFIVFIAGGCQSGSFALDDAATMIAGTVAAKPPTGTPLPTFTPLPLDTTTPRPTVTPLIALTATVESAVILSELDAYVGRNSDIPYQEGHLAWQQVKPITLEMSGPQQDAGILQAIAEDVNPANFIFLSQVTWEASGVLICGLTFRSEPDLNRGKQYQFYFYRLSGLPAYKIDVYESGRFKNSISGVKFSDGIDSNNNTKNEFLLVVQEEQFTVYINGQQQGRFFDPSSQLKDGFLAFLAWQESGKGSCTFEDSWLWILP